MVLQLLYSSTLLQIKLQVKVQVERRIAVVMAKDLTILYYNEIEQYIIVCSMSIRILNSETAIYWRYLQLNQYYKINTNGSIIWQMLYHNQLSLHTFKYLASLLWNRNYGMIMCGDGLQRLLHIWDVVSLLTAL